MKKKRYTPSRQTSVGKTTTGSTSFLKTKKSQRKTSSKKDKRTKAANQVPVTSLLENQTPNTLFKQPIVRKSNLEDLIHGKTKEDTQDDFNEPETDSEVAERWVTVYGFPAEKTSYVLKEFSLYGTVLTHKIGNGNWMHILYASKFEAQRAIASNAKVYDNNSMMIGCMPCQDPAIVNVSKPRFDTSEFSSATKLGESQFGKKRPFSIYSEANPYLDIEESSGAIDEDDIYEKPKQKKKLPEESSWLKNTLQYVFKF